MGLISKLGKLYALNKNALAKIIYNFIKMLRQRLCIKVFYLMILAEDQYSTIMMNELKN